MGSYLKYFIVLSVTFLVIGYLFRNKGEYVKSDIDSNYYLVKGNNPIERANILARINIKILGTFRILEPEINGVYGKNIKNLMENYKGPGVLKESFDNTTYVLNKGQEISICLENFKNENDLFFVVLHELAHLGCFEYGHGTEFVNFFKFLLEKAIKSNQYSYVNYKTSPTEYCDILINSTPFVM